MYTKKPSAIPLSPDPVFSMGLGSAAHRFAVHCARDTSTSRRLEALLEIGDDVFLVLDADREPHHVGAGAGLDLLGVAELAVRGGRRMDDQRAGVADVGEMREHPDVGDELDAGVVAAP